jgi:hypothetical protein
MNKELALAAEYLSSYGGSVGGRGHGGGCSFTGYFESNVRFRFFQETSLLRTPEDT